MPIKAVTHEQFGDGIMSAIDFTVKVEKEPVPHGDRVRRVMAEKFLPFKKWRPDSPASRQALTYMQR